MVTTGTFMLSTTWAVEIIISGQQGVYEQVAGHYNGENLHKQEMLN